MSELAKLITTVEEHTVDDHIGHHGWGVVSKKLLKWLYYYIARCNLWKRAAKKRRMKFFELLDDCEVIDSTYDYWKRIATRRKEWATVWKQRAHLDYMRAFQWRKLATRRLELLRKLDEWLQREPDCPFCGLMCWDDDSARWQHADDCELKKELET